MASSAPVGRRPRISSTRWYSFSFRPSSAQGSAWPGVASAFATVSMLNFLDVASAVTLTNQFLEYRCEDAETVRASTDLDLPARRGVGSEARLHRVLGVGHEPDDVARSVRDAGDVAARAVGVAADVAEDDTALALEF